MLCRVYHDGHAFVAAAPGERPYANWKRRDKKEYELAFRTLYRGTKMGGTVTTQEGSVTVPGMTGDEHRQYIIDTLADTFGEIRNWEEFVDKEFERERKNYYARAKRFRRKAHFNSWNYFVTFTYDNEKQSEDSYKCRLRRALSNLHSRRGWRYMGAFERSETGRLHFHGLFYVPPGEMVGTIEERESYSTKRHCMQKIHINIWFEKRFGRNDFTEITDVDIHRGNTLEYILKYIEKTGERIIYSRGIPSDEVVDIGADQCACEYYNWVRRWVLYDNWREIKHDPDRVMNDEEAWEYMICFRGYEYEHRLSG